MPRIPVRTLDDSPAASQPTVRQWAQAYGREANLIGALANSPMVLGMVTGMVGAVQEHSTLDVRTREAVALAISAVNRCGYCQAAHTVTARSAGWSEEETVALRAGTADVDDKLDALLRVARRIAAKDVDDATWQQALDAGWAEAELAELFGHTMLTVFLNYFDHYAGGIDVDWPSPPPLPVEVRR